MRPLGKTFQKAEHALRCVYKQLTDVHSPAGWVHLYFSKEVREKESKARLPAAGPVLRYARSDLSRHRGRQGQLSTHLGNVPSPFGAAFLLVKAGARNKQSLKSMSTLGFQGIRCEEAAPRSPFNLTATEPATETPLLPGEGQAVPGTWVAGLVPTCRARAASGSSRCCGKRAASADHRASLELDDRCGSWLRHSIGKDGSQGSCCSPESVAMETRVCKEEAEGGRCPGSAWGCQQQQKERVERTLGNSHGWGVRVSHHSCSLTPSGPETLCLGGEQGSPQPTGTAVSFLSSARLHPFYQPGLSSMSPPLPARPSETTPHQKEPLCTMGPITFYCWTLLSPGHTRAL